MKNRNYFYLTLTLVFAVFIIFTCSNPSESESDSDSDSDHSGHSHSSVLNEGQDYSMYDGVVIFDEKNEFEEAKVDCINSKIAFEAEELEGSYKLFILKDPSLDEKLLNADNAATKKLENSSLRLFKKKWWTGHGWYFIPIEDQTYCMHTYKRTWSGAYTVLKWFILIDSGLPICIVEKGKFHKDFCFGDR